MIMIESNSYLSIKHIPRTLIRGSQNADRTPTKLVLQWHSISSSTIVDGIWCWETTAEGSERNDFLSLRLQVVHKRDRRAVIDTGVEAYFIEEKNVRLKSSRILLLIIGIECCVQRLRTGCAGYTYPRIYTRL